ncbi:MAG: hypothetical protein COT09_00825 [Candidatus Hydromicrobium americanum]|nr:MAG: hypothetical protein COT09_00825 [Candidatus Hydromicrobium americanum]
MNLVNDNKINICYLCGKELVGKIDKDHVPPKQFYANDLRRLHNPNLFTLPTHKPCNQTYQGDEDYFVNSIAPLAMDSYSGRYKWKDIIRFSGRPKSKKLVKMIHDEFQPNLSKLLLPPGKIIKKFDGDRVTRIIWKITRGLFFKEKNLFLPEDKPRDFKFFSVGEKPPEYLNYVLASESKGDYPGVFDYKYVELEELNFFNVWLFLLWDRIIIMTVFHNPLCECNVCKLKY